jgi:hypothetical protein
MGVEKVLVTLDADTLREVRRIAGKDVSVSSIVDEGLRLQLHRMRMLALLDDMDGRNPVGPAERKAGENLWEEIVSSSTRGRSRRSRPKRAGSA